MGEIADDIINGACCALCGQYFVKSYLDEEGNEITHEHGYPVACKDCYELDCGYGESDAETF